jgi:OOP family OmpA-OmpF porin
MRATILALIAATATSAAQAQETNGGYMGFALGSFDYEEEDGGITFSDTTTAYRLLGGYRFNENFALEAGWGATSELEDSLTEFVPGFGNVTASITADYEVLTVRALGLIPLQSVSLLGGVGYYDSELDGALSLAGFGNIADFEGSESGATLIGGLQFELERLSIRGEVEWFDTDGDVEAWSASVGLLFRFQ